MSPHADSCAKLLVIDDNPTGRFVICDLLRDRFPDCAVLETDTARVAFSVLRHERIDAVLCHHARGMRDVHLVTALRTIRAGVPIVSTSEPAQVGSLINAGATKFVRYGAWTTISQVMAEVLAGAQAQRAGEAEEPQNPDGSVEPPALNVVVAHPDHAVQTEICAELGKAPGVNVHGHGETAIDALQLVRSMQPELAFIDVAMLDGLDLAAALGVVGCLTQFAYLLAT